MSLLASQPLSTDPWQWNPQKDSSLHLLGGAASLFAPVLMLLRQREQLLDSLAFQPAREPGDCQASYAYACHPNKSHFVTGGFEGNKKEWSWAWWLMTIIPPKTWEDEVEVYVVSSRPA